MSTILRSENGYHHQNCKSVESKQARLIIGEIAEQQRQATEVRIERVFMAALQTVGFRKITVKMLVEAAQINRSTFYLHFLDKYDLLDHIENELFEQIRTLVAAGLAQSGRHQLVRVVIQFIYDHLETFRLLSSERGDPTFMQKYVQAITPLLLADARDTASQSDYSVAAMGGMMTGLFRHWLQQDPPLTPDDYLKRVAQVAQTLPKLLAIYYN